MSPPSSSSGGDELRRKLERAIAAQSAASDPLTLSHLFLDSLRRGLLTERQVCLAAALGTEAARLIRPNYTSFKFPEPPAPEIEDGMREADDYARATWIGPRPIPIGIQYDKFEKSLNRNLSILRKSYGAEPIMIALLAMGTYFVDVFEQEVRGRSQIPTRDGPVDISNVPRETLIILENSYLRGTEVQWTPPLQTRQGTFGTSRLYRQLFYYINTLGLPPDGLATLRAGGREIMSTAARDAKDTLGEIAAIWRLETFSQPGKAVVGIAGAFEQGIYSDRKVLPIIREAVRMWGLTPQADLGR